MHIYLLITRLVLFFTSEMLEPVWQRKCQLAPRRQYISTMEWTVYFSRDWFVDFSAIFLMWDSLFWPVEQTTPYLLHWSCLYKEKLCLQCCSSCLLCKSCVRFCSQFFSLCRACFSLYVEVDHLSFTFSIGRHVKGSCSQSPLLSLNLLFLRQCI